MAALALVTFLIALSGASAATHKVTPVEKVTELLTNLEAKVVEEGKKEAEAYDKYACFCKEQADEKLYNIEKSTKIQGELNAKIQQLTDEITALNGEIGDLTSEISTLTANITAAEGIREGEHATYKVEAADAAAAISACERAIEALKSSKAQMAGKTDSEAFVQVRKVATLAVAWGSSHRSSLSEKQMSMMANLATQPGKAYEYEYHSNDIIATIEHLLSVFTSNKEQLDQEEFETNSAFEKKRLGLQNEKKFAEKEKAEKEAVAEAKTEKKEKATEDLTQETNEKAADQSFLDTLTAECETKAQLFDQRSKVRAGELTAISEAIGALKKGVAPNFQANKKLVGLQIGSHPPAKAPVAKAHWVWVEDAPKAAPSFLQLRGSRGAASTSKEAAVAAKAQELLLQKARVLKSPFLSAAALKVRVAEDHFVKVRGIIKDLIARLKKEADDEASQKSFCDTNMAAAISSRDTEQALLEDLEAQITGKEADKKTLTEEIADLSKAIAENKKALNEATELREEESAENEQTVTDAGAGKDAVDFALSTLKTFYEGAAFVQYVPPNSDREGNTVGDLAPETFDSDYKGSQESSKGIIGMLEVILSDFDRTITTVTNEEAQAVSDYTTFKTNNEADTDTKEKAVTSKEGQISDIEDELVTLTDQKGAAQDALDTALAELDSLHSMCVAGEESYEERVEKRNNEIEALKEAHGILEDWQS